MTFSARLLLAAFCLLSLACSYDKAKQSTDENITVSDPEAGDGTLAAIHFAEVQQAVFLPRCQGCHERIGSELQFQNYDNVIAFLAGIKHRTLEIQDMPRGRKLTAEEFSLVEKWVQQGGPL